MIGEDSSSISRLTIFPLAQLVLSSKVFNNNQERDMIAMFWSVDCDQIALQTHQVSPIHPVKALKRCRVQLWRGCVTRNFPK
jgi:hypothetical protein